MLLVWSDITCQKRNSQKLGLVLGFGLVGGHPTKESEDDWESETSEGKGQIIQK